jgi:uncharacterized glyoxalase superfamily protein PhnB
MDGSEFRLNVVQATPLLRVADVSRSIAWYEHVLGFTAQPFFEHEPYVFAILQKGNVRLMLSRHAGFKRDPGYRGFDVYLTLSGGLIREVYEDVSKRTAITSPLQRMPYADCEFEVTDPDGHVICISELLDDPSGIPDIREE